MSKVGKPGSSFAFYEARGGAPKQPPTKANGSRFAHLAGVALPAIEPPEPDALNIPARGAMKVSAMRAELAEISRAQPRPAAGPIFATAEDAARYAHGVYRRAVEPAKSKPATTEAHKAADRAVALAKRLGIVK